MTDINKAKAKFMEGLQARHREKRVKEGVGHVVSGAVQGARMGSVTGAPVTGAIVGAGTSLVTHGVRALKSAAPKIGAALGSAFKKKS